MIRDPLHAVAFYIPKVLLGVVVVFVGVGIVLGRVVQISILIATLIVGPEQIGLESSLFTVIVAIVIAAVSGGMAGAFGLGSGPLAE